MKITTLATTIALASALAMSSSFAFAQAGEGDSNYEGDYTSGGGPGGSIYSGGYGGYAPSARSYAYEPEVRLPRLTHHRRAHSTTSHDH
jgi:hypothetical protein